MRDNRITESILDRGCSAETLHQRVRQSETDRLSHAILMALAGQVEVVGKSYKWPRNLYVSF